MERSANNRAIEIYNKNRKLYERAIAGTTRDIHEYFEDINADYVHYIKGRVKAIDSILNKKREKKYKDVFQEMDDIAGIRVVCHNESDREEIAAFIKQRFRIHRDEKILKESGYKAHHFVIEVDVLMAGLQTPVKIEIQLRTVAEDLYDTLSRRDMYKIAALPEAWIQKMVQLSDKLREVDKLAEELKQEWINENAQTKMKDLLTAQTIIRIVKSKLNETISINEAMHCQAIVLRYGVSKISELENIFNSAEIMNVIDTIYLELLERKADVHGKIIYGSLIRKFSEANTEIQQEIQEIVRSSIINSPEYRTRKIQVLGKN